MALNQAVIESLGFTEDELTSRMTSNIQEVFSTMVGMDDLQHLPRQDHPPISFENCVTAMVGLAGTYNGLVCLHAPLNLAMVFTSGMLGMEVKEFDDDVRDAIGEIANMAAGSLKQHLSSGGADISLSTPSVVAGKEYSVAAGNPADSFTLHFAAEGESFMVSATLEKQGHAVGGVAVG